MVRSFLKTQVKTKTTKTDLEIQYCKAASNNHWRYVLLNYTHNMSPHKQISL